MSSHSYLDDGRSDEGVWEVGAGGNGHEVAGSALLPIDGFYNMYFFYNKK